MKYSSLSIALLVASAFSIVQPAKATAALLIDTAAATPAEPTAAVKKFDLGVDSIENLQLPLNKVWLYRQAATALIPTDKPRAVMLLKRALSDIDAAEAEMKAQKTPDEKTLQQLEFHRLPVYMLMERIDPAETLELLAPPQSADHDTAFFALFFQRLANSKSPDLVREAAQRKLSYGVTPAVVGAYDVLQKRDPAAAKTLATEIVMKLSKTDPADDPEAVQAAFGLLRLLRTDVGALAPAMTLDQTLLSPENIHDLLAFIGDAFLASKDPEMLIVGQNPGLYVSALEEFAPEKAEDVKQLAFAQPGYSSMIFSPEKPEFDANHPDPSALTPEQLQQRATLKARVEAQLKDSDAQIKLLMEKVDKPALPQKDRDDAVFALVDEANKAISVARAGATTLNRESFRNGEVEFYSPGNVTSVVDTVSSFLQTYAVTNPKIAEAAAQSLDGAEVQTEVGLQIAIREMTGGPAYLVPTEKPPAKAAHLASTSAAVHPATPGISQPTAAEANPNAH